LSHSASGDKSVIQSLQTISSIPDDLFSPVRSTPLRSELLSIEISCRVGYCHKYQWVWVVYDFSL